MSLKGRNQYLFWIALDVVVIILVVLAFILEDQGVDQSLIYSVAGTFVIGYAIWLMRKNGVKVKSFGDLIVVLVLYGILGPVVHLVRSIYGFFTYTEPLSINQYDLNGDFPGAIINIESEIGSQNDR